MSKKIDYDKYKKFVIENNNLSKTEKEIFMEYKKMLGKKYVPQESNRQLETLFSGISEENLYNYEAKIMAIFYKFFKKKIADDLYWYIIKKGKSLKDMDVIYFIRTRAKKEKVFASSKYLRMCDTVAAKWAFILDEITFKYKKILKKLKIKEKSIKYIDIGCGSGSKTIKVGKYLGLSNNDIYGADIEKWGPYNQKKFSF